MAVATAAPPRRKRRLLWLLGVPAALLYKPRTMIFSDTGALLYSEFSQNANSSLTAIADLGDNGSLALVINNQNTYSLKRWSEQHKQFD